MAEAKLKILTDSKQIRAAYERLARRLRQGGRLYSRTVGWPGGHRDVKVWWHERHAFWVAPNPKISSNRYWTAFGLQRPEKHPALYVTCEVNPSKQGVDRRCAGLLLNDGTGNIFLGHSGKVGGGKGGVGKHAFLKWYRGKTETISWTENNKKSTAQAVVFGAIDSPEILFQLGQFVVDVDRFKQSLRKKTADISAILAKEQAKAESEGAFNPDGLIDARKKIAAQIVLRRGQHAFREKLLIAYGGCCAVTEEKCSEVLEAAHIQPYLGEETNHVGNGLILRSDLHTLFDLHLIGVTSKYRLVVSKRLVGTAYEKLSGKKLNLPKDPKRWPNPKVLAQHRAVVEGKPC